MGEALRNDIFPKVPPVTRKYFCDIPNCQFFEASKGLPRVFLSCFIGVAIRGTDRWITYPFDFWNFRTWGSKFNQRVLLWLRGNILRFLQPEILRVFHPWTHYQHRFQYESQISHGCISCFHWIQSDMVCGQRKVNGIDFRWRGKHNISAIRHLHRSRYLLKASCI